MLSTNEGRVYFALDGEDFNPDELTKFLAIEPTHVKRKGEVIGGVIPKVTSWVVSTEDVSGDDLDIYNLSSELVSKLKEKTDLIIEAIKQFKVNPRFEVVLFIAMNEDISTPAIGFEIETVQFLGAVGAFIDIDTYRGGC